MSIAFSATKCMHSLFEDQVCRLGQAPALIWEMQTLTYEALNQRANQLAHYLIQRGVGPEVRVGLLLERSLDMVVSLLAVLKAGGAYVPVDPNYPQERLRMIVDEAELKLVLTQESSRGKLGALKFSELCLDEEREAIASCGTENPDSGVLPKNLAYIIYTSGSTGKPKGVMIEHRGLCNMSAAQLHTFRVTPDERVLQFASVNFDASIFEITMAYCAGASLCVASREAQLSAPVLFRLLRENRITNVTLPPSVLATWEAEDLPDLQTIVVAGEACSAKVVAQWAPGRRFFNAYGPTETTVWASVARCINAEVKPTIGTPIQNAQIHILDEKLEPVAADVIGDLYIGGIGLARGYFKSPALTAEKFIPDPFASSPGERLYHTGDLARRLPDGQIDFVGRGDQQVKLRGFRIELGDIEAALIRHPSVQESVVMLREDQPGQARLVAYLVLRSLPRITGDDLRNYLKTKLPDYMVPAVFVEMLRLPTTPNGKTDRRALPAPEPIRTDRENFVTPRNPVEETVAGIWSELLGLDRIGIYDDLFELGAHSLMLTRAAARLRDQFNVEIPLRCFFDSPTVASLAEAVETTLARGQQHDIKPIKRVPRNSDLPLSFAQERVLFLDQLYGRSKAYNAQVSLRFNGNLDVKALECSLNELVRRHEILRTTFSQEDGQAIQLIHQPEDRKLQIIDLESVPPETREQRLNQLMHDEMNRPFDLDKLPLIRWMLFRLTPEEHLLLQVEHHFLHDGWSFSVLLRELFQIYQAFSQGQPSPLAEPTIQFADFAVWQREFMDGDAAQNQLAYWKRKLADAPALLPLLTDFPRPPVPSFRGKVLRLELPASLSRSVRDLSHRSGCTLFMTMFACFVTLLHRYTNQEDFCIGTGLANRRWKETENLLGMIINTVALRADLSGDPSFEELLRRVREVTVDAYANQDLPFDRVIEAVQPARSLSYSPLYQVTFSFHDAPIVNVDLPELKVNIVEALSNESAKFDLNIVVIPDAGQRYRRHEDQEESGMIMIWEYNTDLFRPDSIARMTTHYQNLLAAMVSDPDQRISELPLLSDQEHQQVVNEWNETESEYEREQCVQQLVEAQALRRPEALAVIYGDEQLTYGELNARSNQLAHYLRGRGVGAEVRVGVLLDRSVAWVVALLGILKAGGAYVPLDSEYPVQRLRFMLEDAGVELILTQRRQAELVSELDTTEIVYLDDACDLLGHQSQENPERVTTAENLAYVMYTSGSTGQPKGVAVTHRAINRLVSNTNYVKLGSSDRMAQVSNASFDAATFEIWGALVHGGQLVGLSKETAVTPAELLREIRAQQISVMFLTTALFNQVAQSVPETFAPLRYLLFGGEACEAQSVRRVLAEGRPQHLLHVYGPTENTTFTTWYEVTEVAADARTVPIGVPVTNTEMYILDPKLKPVPIGVEGELYVSGDGLARGYWQRPMLTAEKFVPNPFSKRPGGRMYRTGDLVRYLPDGALEFLGRHDSQIKLRGYRIELGEIESVLCRYEKVRDATVELRQHETGEPRLVGYVVFSEDDGEKSISALRNYLHEHLPDYMVPSAFVLLPELPITPNGKVDRRALLELDDRTEVERDFVAPRSKEEELVANIWAEVLGLSKVGVEDNFFELGGHSLLATRILARVNSALEVEIPLDNLFRGGTVASLVAAAEQRKASHHVSPGSLSILRRSQKSSVQKSHTLV